MAVPFPLEAYWTEAPPPVPDLARELGLEPDGSDGFVLSLPGSARLYVDEVDGTCVRLARTGPDLLLPFGDAERAATRAITDAVAVALVERCGAELAWSGAYREDVMDPWLEALDEALAGRAPGEPYPVSHLTSAAVVSICVWGARVPVDITETDRVRGLPAWRPRTAGLSRRSP